jgi:FAD/FMN-containing dehydrogenase
MALTRRALLLGAGVAAGAVGARAVLPSNPSGAGMALLPEVTPEGMLNDASLLSPTPVARHLVMTEDPGEALVAALRAELVAAAAAGRPVNIGAARHSMGAQAIPRDGTAITFDNGYLEPGDGVFRAHAGARWGQVIAALDPLGLSPKVMQSNNDFGVAATFSVNAHGWATAHGPMGATVRKVEMMLSDGSLITASREENAPIFAAAMGGYGLIGLITALEVETAPNQLLEPTFKEMPAEDFSAAFAGAVKTVPMAYGRLNVDRDGVFAEAMMVTYAPVAGEIPAVSGSGALSKASRLIFRAQLGNEWVKARRWGIETGIGASLQGAASRNSLFNEPVITLDDRDPSRTDILHEYFVAPEAFGDFLTACRAIIPASYQELLNVTLRWVEQDATSLLSYAPEGPAIAAVMLFSQEMSARAEADMARMTRALIEAVQGMGGHYYLPYRPHATLDQFRRGYARAGEFATLKRSLDPGLLLRGGLWDNYLAQL